MDQIDQDGVGPDTPLRLKTAAQIAFPGETMTVSGLRRERDRRRLVTERIAGKEFTTLRHIERMRELCRAQPKDQDYGSNPKSETSKENLSGTKLGPLETERKRSALAALELTARGLSKPSKSTLPKNTQSRATARVILLNLVLDVLNIYLADKAPNHSDPMITKARVMIL